MIKAMAMTGSNRFSFLNHLVRFDYELRLDLVRHGVLLSPMEAVWIYMDGVHLSLVVSVFLPR
jgi:hypothetical protein